MLSCRISLRLCQFFYYTLYFAIRGYLLTFEFSWGYKYISFHFVSGFFISSVSNRISFLISVQCSCLMHICSRAFLFCLRFFVDVLFVLLRLHLSRQFWFASENDKRLNMFPFFQSCINSRKIVVYTSQKPRFCGLQIRRPTDRTQVEREDTLRITKDICLNINSRIWF